VREQRESKTEGSINLLPSKLVLTMIDSSTPRCMSWLQGLWNRAMDMWKRRLIMYGNKWDSRFLTDAIVNTVVFWVMTLCIFVCVRHRFWRTYLQDGDRKFIRNTDDYIRDYTVFSPRWSQYYDTDTDWPRRCWIKWQGKKRSSNIAFPYAVSLQKMSNTFIKL
jgi:hypothetical protein